MDRKKWYKEAYLKSEHWKLLKRVTLQSQGRICCKCGALKKLQIHHKTYVRLWKELQSDLMVVCVDCHKKIHGIKKKRKKKFKK